MSENTFDLAQKINNFAKKLGIKGTQLMGLVFIIIIVISIASCSNRSENVTPSNPIESQFSAWNGEHINLTRVIKASMNNPKSFEHVSSTYTSGDNYLIVTEVYRGTNVYGGIVTDSVKAKVDMSGNVLEILK